MTHLFIYLIEASICLLLLYLCYVLLINNDTFYRLKRFYLLFSIVISIAIPQLPSVKDSKEFKQIISTYTPANIDFSSYKDTFEQVVFGMIPEKPVLTDSDSGNYILLIILLSVYVLGIIFLIYRLINNITQLLRIAEKNNIEPYGDYTIVHHNDDYPTFSFFRYIYLNSKNLDSHDMSTVLKHEEAHIKNWHSVDMIFIELCKIVFWFNPAIWSFKKSLIKVHECEVDDYLIATRQEDVSNYQSLLLKQYLSNINIELAHPFNYSLVKFRIKMMTKTKSKWMAKYKMLFAIPVVMLSLLAFSNANISLSKQEFTELANSAKVWEPEPNGMCFIPAGSFVLKRTDGSTTKEFQVTIDPFWMNQTEVSVKQYFEYLSTVKKDSSEKVWNAAMPDIGKAPFTDYFSNKKYADFPVVGVSLKQAMSYCQWLTRRENQKLKSKGKPPVQNFRIPSEVEWVYASFGRKNPADAPIPKIKELHKISINKPNDWGLYNMSSNVSEWTYTSFDPIKYMVSVQNFPGSDLDKIIVRGDNYKESLNNDKLILNGTDSYDFVGFRYVRTYLGPKYGKN
jgi:formylglycine-generating enzyme required for sulfatase activity